MLPTGAPPFPHKGQGMTALAKVSLLIVSGIALGLTACSSTVALQSASPDTKINGTVTRGPMVPDRVEVILDGRTYRGKWRTGAPTREQKAATSYPHRFHVSEARSILSADDGDKLDCRWLMHGDTGEGTCSAGGRVYPMILK